MDALSAFPNISSVVSRKTAPASRNAFPPSKSLSLISGPLVSCIVASGSPNSSAAFLALPSFISCSAWSPCEKLNRATFIPARSSSFNFSSVCETVWYFCLLWILPLWIWSVSIREQYLSAIVTIHASRHIGGFTVSGHICLIMISSWRGVKKYSFFAFFSERAGWKNPCNLCGAAMSLLCQSYRK